MSIDRMLGTGNSTAPPATGSPGDEQGWWTNPKAQVRRAPSLLPAPPNTNFKFAKENVPDAALPPRSQDITFDVLAGCYAVIALVALIQLIRIQRRVPEYG